MITSNRVKSLPVPMLLGFLQVEKREPTISGSTVWILRKKVFAKIVDWLFAC